MISVHPYFLTLAPDPAGAILLGALWAAAELQDALWFVRRRLRGRR